MIRKVLVYENVLVDKHPALERALQLARHGRIEPKIVDIVNGPSDPLRDLRRSMRTVVEQERKERLYSMCEPIHEQHIEFSMEIAT